MTSGSDGKVESEIVTVEKLLISNMIRLDTVLQLLLDKGFFTEKEFNTKMKEVKTEYARRRKKVS
jgi:hypothetical protein